MCLTLHTIFHSKYQVIEEHIRIVTSQSNCNRVDIPARLNVPYMKRKENPSAATKLDIFGTDLPKTSPIFVYFSGGYWQVTIKDQLRIIKTILTSYKNESQNCISHNFSIQALNGEISAYPVGPLHMNNIVSIIVDYDRAPKGMTYSGYLNIPDYDV